VQAHARSRHVRESARGQETLLERQLPSLRMASTSQCLPLVGAGRASREAGAARARTAPCRRVACAAAAPRFSDIQPAEEYHILAQAEIPSHLPRCAGDNAFLSRPQRPLRTTSHVFLRRPDFLKQLFRWAVQYADDGEDVNKPPMRCDVIDVSSVLSVGFTVSIMRYNEAGQLESECDLECLMDDEEVQAFDVVGMDDQGFPKLQTQDGQERLVKGKNFLIRCAAERRDARERRRSSDTSPAQPRQEQAGASAPRGDGEEAAQ
jgi:hypothetical protein